MSVRRLVLVLLAVLAAAPTAAQARVRVLQAAAGSPGQYATLAVSVTPSANCSITVMYKSGPSEANGLDQKRGSRINWTWKIGTRTTPGTWPILVTCGRAGSLRTAIRVA